jgi:predicted nucleic acid-binding protein
LEYEAVLTRTEHLAAADLSSEQARAVLDALAAVSERIRFSFRWRPLLADANDDMVIETAINGSAQLLVTFNLRDFGTVGEPFGCRAVLPRDATELVRANAK